MQSSVLLHQAPTSSDSCAAVQDADLHGVGVAKARQRSRILRAAEHRVQLAALDQNAQLPKPSSAPALNTDAAARDCNRHVDTMDIDGAPGSNEQIGGQGAGRAASGEPSHGSQARASPAAPSLQTKHDIMVSLVAIMQPLMVNIADMVHRSGPVDEPVDQQSLTNLQQMCNTVGPHWKAVQQVAQPSSIGKASAVQTGGGKPSQQANKGGTAKRHAAAKPPTQTGVIWPSGLPEGEIAAAPEQAVVEAAKRLAGPQGCVAADRRLGEANTTSLEEPAPGQRVLTAAGL